MTKSIFKDKFPINSLQINKSKTSYKSANEIASYFEEKINQHPVAKHISTFNNFEHTSNINGAIQDGIISALVVIFCVGKEIPTPKILAIRPRAFGITEFEDSFSIDFMDAPSENLLEIMSTWTKELINK